MGGGDKRWLYSNLEVFVSEKKKLGKSVLSRRFEVVYLGDILLDFI